MYFKLSYIYFTTVRLYLEMIWILLKISEILDHPLPNYFLYISLWSELCLCRTKSHWSRIWICEMWSCKTAFKKSVEYTTTSATLALASWFSRCKSNLVMYITLAISTKCMIYITTILLFFQALQMEMISTFLRYFKILS